MGMVVIQPYILVAKLKKTKTKFLCCTGYLNSIKTLLSKMYCLLCHTAVTNMLSSTVKRYMRDPVKIYFGLLRIQVKF